jgi:phosphoribosylaminoimidazolecarboxamide formyltransferase/IMP cyclohydrolase
MDKELVPIRRAIASVTDKGGLGNFARQLNAMGVEFISTGGTARALSAPPWSVPVLEVSEVTGFPEMMDGRVKTLNGKVFGGILAKRDNPVHMAEAAANGIEMIDLVVVNLYQFDIAVMRQSITLPEAVEQIDIGGPSLLRAAAKNFEWVTVICDPADYELVYREMRENSGATTLETRKRLALKVFEKTSRYDEGIANWLREH